MSKMTERVGICIIRSTGKYEYPMSEVLLAKKNVGLVKAYGKFMLENAKVMKRVLSVS